MADVSRQAGIKRSKRTPRIIAAYAFLKNISLDASEVRNTPTSKTESTNELDNPKVTWANEDPDVAELICKLDAIPSTTHRSLHQSLSITCTNNIEKETSGGKMGLQKIDELSDNPKEIFRAKSLVDSSLTSAFRETSRLTFLSSPTLFKQSERYLNSRRIVLVTSSHKVPFGIFSVVPYNRESKGHIESKRGSAVHQSGNNPHKLDGVEIGEGKRVVSYSHLLVPAVRTRGHFENSAGEEPEEEVISTAISPREAGDASLDSSYKPLVLDDPDLTLGKHRTVLQLPSLTLSIFQYAKPSELKRDINARFRERFPNLQITLTKLRSVKSEMTEIGNKCTLDPGTIACAHVYFEKLVLMGKITKTNRKYCAGACLLLSGKFNDDLRKNMVNPLIEGITERFRLHLKDLLYYELQVLVCLEFSLCLTSNEVLPLFRRLDSM